MKNGYKRFLSTIVTILVSFNLIVSPTFFDTAYGSATTGLEKSKLAPPLITGGQVSVRLNGKATGIKSYSLYAESLGIRELSVLDKAEITHYEWVHKTEGVTLDTHKATLDWVSNAPKNNTVKVYISAKTSIDIDAAYLPLLASIGFLRLGRINGEESLFLIKPGNTFKNAVLMPLIETAYKMKEDFNDPLTREQLVSLMSPEQIFEMKVGFLVTDGLIADYERLLSELTDSKDIDEVTRIIAALRPFVGQTVLLDGFRIWDSRAIGPAKGGLRFAPKGDLDLVRTLAGLMSWKCSASGIAYGGGKGEVSFTATLPSGEEISINPDPRLLPVKLRAEISRSFARGAEGTKGLAYIMSPLRDVPAGDMNTDMNVMSWILDETLRIYVEEGRTEIDGLPVPLEVLKRAEELAKSDPDFTKTPYIDVLMEAFEKGEWPSLALLATITGKPFRKTGKGSLVDDYAGGYAFRNDSTGVAQVQLTKHAINKGVAAKVTRHDGQYFTKLEGATGALQGFGNVGMSAALEAHREGVKIIGLSDISGSIYAEDGRLPVDEIVKWFGSYKKGNGRNATLHDWYKAEGNSLGVKHTGDTQYILYMDVDILFPDAKEEQITGDNAAKIKAKVISEGANAPTTPEADKILQEKGIIVIPDFLANAGGVIGSYFEWIQTLTITLDNLKHATEESMYSKGKEEVVGVLTRAFDKILEYCEKKKISPTQLRLAARIIAIRTILNPPDNALKPELQGQVVTEVGIDGSVIKTVPLHALLAKGKAAASASAKYTVQANVKSLAKTQILAKRVLATIIEMMRAPDRAERGSLAVTALQYCETRGIDFFLNILSLLAQEAGIKVNPKTEILTADGVNEILDTIGIVLLDKGDVVIYDREIPGDDIMPCRKFGAEFRALNLDVRAGRYELERMLKKGAKIKFVHVPLMTVRGSVALNETAQNELLELAKEYGFIIVEDARYASAIPQEGENSLKAKDGKGAESRVAQIRSFDRLLGRGVKLAYWFSPPGFSVKGEARKANTTLHTNAFGQVVAFKVLLDAIFEGKMPPIKPESISDEQLAKWLKESGIEEKLTIYGVEVRLNIVREILKLAKGNIRYLAGGIPFHAFFPFEFIAEVVSGLTPEETEMAMSGESPVEGLNILREMIVLRMNAQAKKYGVDAEFSLDDVVALTGSQDILELMARWVKEKAEKEPKRYSNTIVAQEPATYLGMLSAAKPYGCNVIKREFRTVEGIKRFRDELQVLKDDKKPLPLAIYVMPNYGNPTSDVMSLEAREELVKVAAEFGIIIFEDDPYGELRYKGPRLPSLAEIEKRNIRQEIQAKSIVVRSSSFSKIAMPGLRLAWFTGQEEIRNEFISYIRGSIGAPSTLNQVIMAKLLMPQKKEYFKDVLTAEKNAEITEEEISIVDYQINYVLIPGYEEKAGLMQELLAEHFGSMEGASWVEPTGGLFVRLELPEGVDSRRLLDTTVRDLEHNGINGINGVRVAFVPGGPSSDKPEGIRLCFSTATPEEMIEAIPIIALTVRKLQAFDYLTAEIGRIKTASIDDLQLAFSQLTDQINDDSVRKALMERLQDLRSQGNTREMAMSLFKELEAMGERMAKVAKPRLAVATSVAITDEIVDALAETLANLTQIGELDITPEGIFLKASDEEQSKLLAYKDTLRPYLAILRATMASVKPRWQVLTIPQGATKEQIKALIIEEISPPATAKLTSIAKGAGTPARLYRIIIDNVWPDQLFTVRDLVDLGNASEDTVRREIEVLLGAGLVVERTSASGSNPAYYSRVEVRNPDKIADMPLLKEARRLTAKEMRQLKAEVKGRVIEIPKKLKPGDLPPRKIKKVTTFSGVFREINAVYFANFNSFTLKALAKSMGVSEDTIGRRIKVLVELGLVKQVDTYKGVVYLRKEIKNFKQIENLLLLNKTSLTKEELRSLKADIEVEVLLSQLAEEDMLGQLEVLYGKTYEEAVQIAPKMAKVGFDLSDKKEPNRLGWTLANFKWIAEHPEKVEGVIEDAETIRANYKYVIFCGMGGSGLSVQTVKTTFGEKDIKIYSLRTTDPAVIKDMLDEIARDAGSLEKALAKTLIVPISKSGTTQETVSHKEYFEELFGKIGLDAAKHMWVITDKGSPFDAGNFIQRPIQLNEKGDIGGRFTSPTTSIFLLPLAIVAPERVKTILDTARKMNEIKDVNENIFVRLGTYLYHMAAVSGKDKLTFMVPEELKDLPLWSEQLFEESLGKDGKGVTVFYGENISQKSLNPVAENDRVFLRINVGGKKTNEELWNYLKENGYPVFEIDIEDINSIGSLMFGLQTTVATIGYLWDICFVDQPSVEGYKKATNAVMQAGGKIEVQKTENSIDFGKLTLHIDSLLKTGAISKEELQAEVKRLGAAMDDAAAVYAAIINLLKAKPGFEAMELTSYGRMTTGLRGILENVRKSIFTDGFQIPCKLGEGPDKNHSYQQNIEGGKDMWFSTYLMPLVVEQPSALKYNENLIKAQTIGTVNSITDRKRKAVLITVDPAYKDAEADVAEFFTRVHTYLFLPEQARQINIEKAVKAVRTPFVAANWKMEIGSKEQAITLLKEIAAKLKGISGVEVVIAPSIAQLGLVSQALKELEKSGEIFVGKIRLAAQNIAGVEKGAQTGRTGILQIKDAGAAYVILGHSEQIRASSGEIDKDESKAIPAKVKLALEHGVIPIICVGENVDEKMKRETKQVVEGMLKTALTGVTPEQVTNLILAYEPVWAIGTGKVATASDAEEVLAYIREYIFANFGLEAASKVRIIYGGSVKPDNIGGLLDKSVIPNNDGALVGGASLKAESFGAIVRGATPKTVDILAKLSKQLAEIGFNDISTLSAEIARQCPKDIDIKDLSFIVSKDGIWIVGPEQEEKPQVFIRIRADKSAVLSDGITTLIAENKATSVSEIVDIGNVTKISVSANNPFERREMVRQIVANLITEKKEIADGLTYEEPAYSITPLMERLIFGAKLEIEFLKGFEKAAEKARTQYPELAALIEHLKDPNSGSFKLEITKELAEKWNLKKGLADVVKAMAPISVAGMRNSQNPLAPFDLNSPMNILLTLLLGNELAETALKIAAEQEAPMTETIIGGEVRYNTPLVSEMLRRRFAKLGITVHSPARGTYLPIGATSFITTVLNIMFTMYDTASHSARNIYASKLMGNLRPPISPFIEANLEKLGIDVKAYRRARSEGAQLLIEDMVALADNIGRKIDDILETGEPLIIEFAAGSDEHIHFDIENPNDANNIPVSDKYAKYLRGSYVTPSNIQAVREALANGLKIGFDQARGSAYQFFRGVFEKVFNREAVGKISWTGTIPDSFFGDTGMTDFNQKQPPDEFVKRYIEKMDTKLDELFGNLPLTYALVAAISERELSSNIGETPRQGKENDIVNIKFKIFAKEEEGLLKRLGVPYRKLANSNLLAYYRPKMADISEDVSLLQVVAASKLPVFMLNQPIGFVYPTTDPDGDRFVLMQVEKNDKETKERLKHLNVAYLVLSDEKILAVYVPNQTFLQIQDAYIEQLKEEGKWKQNIEDPNAGTFFSIKTTVSSSAWLELSNAEGIPVVQVPVGFKEIGSIMRKVESQLMINEVRRKLGLKPRMVVMHDIFGNPIRLGYNPRLLFAGEESGGMVVGSTELLTTEDGLRRYLSWREKNAVEASVLTFIMISKRFNKAREAALKRGVNETGLYQDAEFLQDISLSNMLQKIIEQKQMQNTAELRTDVDLVDALATAQATPERRKEMLDVGFEWRDNNFAFFLSLAFALENGHITLNDVKAILKEVLVKDEVMVAKIKAVTDDKAPEDLLKQIDDLQRYLFTGDAVYMEFSNGTWEIIRPSGTEARIKSYPSTADARISAILSNAIGEVHPKIFFKLTKGDTEAPDMPNTATYIAKIRTDDSSLIDRGKILDRKQAQYQRGLEVDTMPAWFSEPQVQQLLEQIFPETTIDGSTVSSVHIFLGPKSQKEPLMYDSESYILYVSWEFDDLMKTVGDKVQFLRETIDSSIGKELLAGVTTAIKRGTGTPARLLREDIKEFFRRFSEQTVFTVPDLAELGNASRSTIRRELEVLVALGLVRKVGSVRGSVAFAYQLDERVKALDEEQFESLASDELLNKPSLSADELENIDITRRVYFNNILAAFLGDEWLSFSFNNISHSFEAQKSKGTSTKVIILQPEMIGESLGFGISIEKLIKETDGKVRVIIDGSQISPDKVDEFLAFTGLSREGEGYGVVTDIKEIESLKGLAIETAKEDGNIIVVGREDYIRTWSLHPEVLKLLVRIPQAVREANLGVLPAALSVVFGDPLKLVEKFGAIDNTYIMIQTTVSERYSETLDAYQKQLRAK